jgi:outer membrane protein OmpA-like peptidoglycan-associated protein
LAPIISSDGKTLYFTRGGHPDNLGAEKQQDLWYAVSSNGVDFGTPINIGSPINNSSNNFAISVTPDNNTLLLGNVFPKNQPPSTGLSLSRRTETGWSYPEALLIPQMNSKSKQNSYSLGNDGKTLLLSIYRDDSYGDNDLYVSFLTENNTWTPPKNLGAKINTAGNEISPFLASDGRTLYFSSNGYPGYGKNDLFLIRRIDDTWQNWSEPINLGNKINSIYWDAYFSVTASGDYAYFVSSTQASFSEDIYRIALPKAVQPTSVVLISGKVFNKQTKSPASATIIYEELPSGKQIGVAHSNPATGEYKITLPAGKNYGFLAQAQGFIAINENLNLLKQKEYQEIKRDLYLVPIEKGESVKLNNIFFESAKFEILPESFPELNRIVLMMNENPRLKIRIEGHTDNVGNDLTNKILSENRAKSIADYLISKGIAGNRFSHKGYGKKKPVAKNSTEEGRRMNRRVEFIILEK